LTAPPLRLVVDDLALERGGRALVSGLSFSLAAGEALLVTGPNGAGKSTLLRALAGLLRPARGLVRLEGAGADIGARLGAHYLGHADALKSSLTAAENLAFWAAALAIGAPGGLTPEAALDRVGLAAVADLPIAYLSAGQRRRVALARLLTARRPVWLLDEPTTALDQASQRRLEAMLSDHLAQGGTAVIATHTLIDLPGARELRLGAR
jgi:heme exporter protein A